LDLAVFFENANQRDDLQLIDRNSDITQQLSSLSTRAGFSVAAQVPRLESFEEFLAHEPAYNVYDYHLSLKVLDFIAARGKMDRDSYRQLALKIQGEHWFNQEAIFIFRSKKNMSLRIEQLSRLGYRNFILLDESESVFHRIPA